MTEPTVVMLDEPTRGIDVGAKLEVYELINRLTAEGKAVILVSSELPELMGMSDRIVMLHEGKIGGVFSRAEFTQERLLAAAMGTENGVFQRDGEVTIGVTYLTGSLVKLGQKLAGALMGDADRWAWLPYLLLWLGFVAGVILGAGAHAAWGWRALWFAAAASAALTGLMARIARRKAPATAGPWG